MKEIINAIPAEIYSIQYNEPENVYILFLKEKNGTRIIGMNITYFDTQLLSMAIGNNYFGTQFLHDVLLKNFNRNNQKVDKFVIAGFSDGIFYGELVLKNDESYECRPPDGLILALKSDAEILIEESVLEEVGLDIRDATSLEQRTLKKQQKSIDEIPKKKKKNIEVNENILHNYISQKDYDGAELIKSKLIDACNEQLTEAVHLEDYEKAVKLRDKINDLIKIKIYES